VRGKGGFLNPIAWGRKAMTSTIDSLTPIWHLILKTIYFRLSLTVKKLFECKDLAGISAFGFGPKHGVVANCEA
jgi:hypothetical protein